MTTPEPPEEQWDPQPVVPPVQPSESGGTPPPDPYATEVAAESLARVGYPADNLPSPFDPEPESNRAPIIAGVITGVLALIALGIFIYANRPEPAATPPTSEPRPVTTLSPSTTTTTLDAAAARPYDLRFEESRCEFSLLTDAEFECGWLVVPEDRQQPDNGREVRLHVARFKSTNPDVPADPLIYLDGGPGGSTLEPLQFSFNQVWQPLLEDRDVIFFDQRGVGLSEPSLDCPEERQRSFSVLDQDLDPATELADSIAALATCQDRLEGDGIDLSQFTSAENAADVADLRVAMGYDEVNLLGISYGTRLALTVMRDHPEGIRSVILDSVYPPEVDLFAEQPINLDRALSELWEGCDLDPACAERYPNLEERFYSIVDAYNETPTRAPVRDFLNGASWDVLFDGEWIISTVFQGLYSEQVIPLLPQMIEELEDRNTSTLSLLASNTLSQSEFISYGMNFSVQCNEEASFSSQDAVDAAWEELDRLAVAFGKDADVPDYTLSVCETWNSDTGPATENDPVVSEIPALVLAGEYDPITPPAWGAGAAATLTNSTFIEFPGLGHGTSIADDCPLNIMFEFLNDPTGSVDTGCIRTMAPIEFKIPGEAAAEINMVPFSEDILGTLVSGLVPEGWESIGFGAYARGDSAIDQTALLQQVAPFVTADALVSLLVDQFGMVAEPEQTSTQETGLGAWRLFRGDADGFSIDIAAIDLPGPSSASGVVVLISDVTERETLIGSVLVPAIEAFRVQT